MHHVLFRWDSLHHPDCKVTPNRDGRSVDLTCNVLRPVNHSGPLAAFAPYQPSTSEHSEQWPRHSRQQHGRHRLTPNLLTPSDHIKPFSLSAKKHQTISALLSRTAGSVNSPTRYCSWRPASVPLRPSMHSASLFLSHGFLSCLIPHVLLAMVGRLLGATQISRQQSAHWGF